MKPKHSKSWMSLVVLAVLSLIFAGCHSVPPPVAWNLRLTKLTPASIDVDIVGVRASDEAHLMNMKPDDWWASPPNDLTRRDYKDMMLTSNFQAGDTWAVGKDDPMWNKWLSSGVKEIMMIANLPRVHENTTTDPRRMFLKLTRHDWKGLANQTIEIQVKDGGVYLITAPTGK